jgi:hypothetical protein
MTSYINNVVVDCRNAYALSEWWKRVLGYAEGNEFCILRSQAEIGA